MANAPPSGFEIPGQNAAQEKQGLFKHSSGTADMGPLYDELNSISARLRINEERYTNFRKKMQLVENNMLSNHRNVSVEFKAINAEISEMHREIADLQNKLRLMINEFQTFAKKEDVKVLEKYVNLWEPIKFVTAKEAERIANEVFEARQAKLDIQRQK